MWPAPGIVRWRWNLRTVFRPGMGCVFGIGCVATCYGLVAALLTISADSNYLVVIINLRKSMSTKTPECWASDPNARAVRIELSAEQSLLLPFDQFAFSELKSDGKEQTLRLVFATHEVLLHGYSLRRVETAMQRMELSYLASVPDKHWSLIPEGQPAIGAIVVTEAHTTGEPPHHEAA